MTEICGAQDAENQDGGGIGLSLTPRIDLRSALAIRRELAAVYRDARTGKLALADATRLGYLLELLRRSVETSDLQERIEALERGQGRGYGNKH